jgi:hypothetical protein
MSAAKELWSELCRAASPSPKTGQAKSAAPQLTTSVKAIMWLRAALPAPLVAVTVMV